MNAGESTPESTRRGDVPGVPFRLADGREWHLATPSILYRPEVEGGKVVAVLVTRDFRGPALKHLCAIREAIRADPDAVPVDRLVMLGIELLMSCHDLGAGDAAALFDLTADELRSLLVTIAGMFRDEAGAEAAE